MKTGEMRISSNVEDRRDLKDRFMNKPDRMDFRDKGYRRLDVAGAPPKSDPGTPNPVGAALYEKAGREGLRRRELWEDADTEGGGTVTEIDPDEMK